VIGIAVGHDGPKLMAHQLLVRLLLPSFEDLMVQELLGEFILGCDVQDELRIDHDSPQD
jgi:hypothetical protein